MKFILVFILLYSFKLPAQVFERYCLQSSKAAGQTLNEISPILIPGKDNVTQEAECLNITTTETRKELIRNYIQSRTTQPGSYTFSEISTPKPCKIELKKRVNSNLANQNVLLNPSSVNVGANQENKEMLETSTLLLASGLKSSFTINRQVIGLTCTVINESSAKLTLSMTVLPLPVVLGVTPQAPVPPTEKNVEVTSEVIITNQNEVQIASNVKDLQNKASKISLDSGLTLANSLESENFDIRVRLSP